MTMNHADAQAFFDCSSKSFSQLKAVFVALETEASKGGLSPQARDLVGAGLHIAEHMSEIVGCWADEAAEPWLEDALTTPQAENKPVTTYVDAQPNAKVASENLTKDDIEARLLEIKVLVDSVDRMIWQDGGMGADENQLTDATYLTTIASRMLSDLWSRINYSDEIKPKQDRSRTGKRLTGA